jgi:hypothetical protein
MVSINLSNLRKGLNTDIQVGFDNLPVDIAWILATVFQIGSRMSGNLPDVDASLGDDLINLVWVQSWIFS